MGVSGRKILETCRLPGAIIAAANGAAVGLQQFWNWLFPVKAIPKWWVLLFTFLSVLAVVIGFIAEHMIKEHGDDNIKQGAKDKTDAEGIGAARGSGSSAKDGRRSFEDYVQEAHKDADRARKETRNS